MNQRNLFIIVLLFFCKPALSQSYDSTYGKPLIVLIETDPWAMVLGSDVPSFALYEHGQVIYREIEDRHLKFYHCTLNQPDIQKLIASFSIPKGIYHLKEYIEASYTTDQPTNELILNLESKVTISVYGHLNNDKVRKKVPDEFLSLYDTIKKFKIDSATAWLPDKFEVMFWDYDYAPDKRPWPAIFPDLNSPTTIKRGDMYSVYIEKKYFDVFKKYYEEGGEKEAVEINGRKWPWNTVFLFLTYD